MDQDIVGVEKASERVSEYNEEERIGNDPDLEKILDIVRKFIRDNNLVLYGGTAINAQIPEDAQFYDYSREIPDYDFYSMDAKRDAIRLADQLYQAGYKDANARSGVHEGTYKVSANFQQVADITQMAPEVMEKIDIVRLSDGMLYAGPMWLRVDMYKQLSEIKGQPARWPKVYKRLQLLNQYHPLKQIKECEDMRYLSVCPVSTLPLDQILPVIIQHAVMYRRVFVGSMSHQLFRSFDQMMDTRFSFNDVLKQLRCMEGSSSLIDLLSLDPQEDMRTLRIQLTRDFPSYDVRVKRLPDSPELFKERHQLTINGMPIAELMQPFKCYGYVEINTTSSSYPLRIATLDTLITIMLGKMFTDSSPSLSLSTKAKYMCMLEYLMGLVEQKGNLEGEGVFARFPTQCYGEQERLSDVFQHRWENRINRLMANKKGIYLENPILNYRPHDEQLIRKGLIDPYDRKGQRNRSHLIHRNANQSFDELNTYYQNGQLSKMKYLELCEDAHTIKHRCVFAKQKWTAGCSAQELCHCMDDVTGRLRHFDHALMSSVHQYNR